MGRFVDQIILIILLTILLSGKILNGIIIGVAPCDERGNGIAGLIAIIPMAMMSTRYRYKDNDRENDNGSGPGSPCGPTKMNRSRNTCMHE